MRLELKNLQTLTDEEWPFPMVLLRLTTRVNGKRRVYRYWNFEPSDLHDDIRESEAASKHTRFEVLAVAEVAP